MIVPKKALDVASRGVLIKSGSDSGSLRQGAHHIFRNQSEVGFNDLLVSLTRALESSTVPELATVAAYDILKRMKAKS